MVRNIAQADIRLDGFGLRINRIKHRLELSDAWVLCRYTREELDGKPAMNWSRPLMGRLQKRRAAGLRRRLP
jgi:hypothetical protein